MTDSLFQDDNNTGNNNNIDPNKNYLEELVGEGRKFKSPEELARGKMEADNYVAHLLREQDALRRDYEKALADSRAKANFEELLTRYENVRNNNDDDDMNQNRREDDDKPSLDLSQIESLITQKISETAKQAEQSNNFKKVQNKLKETFGDNFSSVLKQKIDNTPGLTVEMVDNLARTSPDAVYNLLGVNQQRGEQFLTPPSGSQRNDNFSPAVPQKRTRSFYVKMRATDPKKYYDPKTSVQMYQDSISNPDFFDTEE